MEKNETDKKDGSTSPDGKLHFPKSFLILGGGSILVMAGVVVYTIFFYLTLPSHRALDKNGEAIRHVPLPVPPNTFLPSGQGKTVDLFEKPDFRLRVDGMKKTLTGFDASVELLAKTNGTDDSGLSFAVVGTPRWVDSNRNSGKGLASLSTGSVFRKGAPGRFTIHFSRMPTSSSFDLYIGLVGTRGIKGDRYLIHFANLKTPLRTS